MSPRFCSTSRSGCRSPREGTPVGWPRSPATCAVIGELAFYGAEDLVPSDFYSEQDANRAFEGARFAVDAAAAVVPGAR